MKQLFSIFMISLIFIAVSCKKDAVKAQRQTCDSCGLTLTNLIINDSNWTKQADGSYQSDITSQIIQGGGTVSQVYTIEILSEGTFFQIYPNYSALLMGGTFNASVSNHYDADVCTITYRISDQEKHFGESPNAAPTTLHSVEIRVMLAK